MSQARIPPVRLPSNAAPPGQGSGEADSLAGGDDRLLDSAIAEYLERLDRGEVVDRCEFLARNPGLADDLRAFFDDSDEVQRLVGALPPLRQAPEPDSTSESWTVAVGETAAQVPAAADRNSARQTEAFGQAPARYRILGNLGQGGMGVVYLAHDTHLNRRVALKVPHANALCDPERITRFLMEARLAATLQHPNICQIFDVGQMQGEMQGIPYITMAYIDGRTLCRAIADSGPLPVRQAASLVAKIAGVLQEAHNAGVVHRDLKPSNIMIDQRQEPVITDFGLALQLNLPAGQRLTQTGILMGTPAYMSPEQLVGDPETIGTATDIYSLGVVLFELLTGRVPFEGSRPAIVAQVLKDTPPNLRDVRGDVPLQLDAICRRMMARNPRDRYPNMLAVRDALEDFLKSDAATDRSLSQSRSDVKEELSLLPSGKTLPRVDTEPVAKATTIRVPPAVPKSRRRAAAISAVSLVLVLAGVVGLIRPGSGNARIDVDESVGSNLEIRIDDRQVEVRDAKISVSLPPGRHTWSVHRGDDLLRAEDFLVVAGETANLAVTLTEPVAEPVPVADTPLKPALLYTLKFPGESVAALVVSPDGSELAAASGRTIRRWNLSSGTELESRELTQGEDVESLAWDPSGRLLAVGTAGTVQFVNLAGDSKTAPRAAIKHLGTSTPALALSANGRWLAAAIQGADVSLWTISGDGEVPALQGDTKDAISIAFSPDNRLLATGFRSGDVRLWDVETGKLLRTLPAPERRALSIAFSPASATLAVGYSGGRLGVWDVTRGSEANGTESTDTESAGNELRSFVGHASDVTSVAFHPSGRYLASASGDHTVRLWDVRSGTEVHRLHQRDEVEAVAFGGDGRLVAAAAGGLIPVWQLPAAMILAPGPGLIATLADHQGYAETLAFSADGRFLLSAGTKKSDAADPDSDVRLWDVRTGKVSRRFSSAAERIVKVRFSSVQRQVIAMSVDGLFQFWDADSGNRTHDFDGAGLGPVGSGPVADFDVLPGRPELVIVGTEGHAIVRLDNLKTVSRWKVEGDSIGSVAAISNSSGRFVLSGSRRTGAIRLWSTPLLTLLGEFAAPSENVDFLAATPDGRAALSGARARFTSWNLSNFKPLQNWERSGPNAPYYHQHVAAISFDGTRVLLTTQASPPSVVLLDAVTGEQLHEFRGHTGHAVNAVAFSPDGALAASAGLDGTILLWRLPEAVDRERRAAAWVIDNGGHLGLAGVMEKRGMIHARADLPEGPLACTKIALIDAAAVTDAGLEALSGLSSLDELKLAGTAITDAGLARLKGLPALRLLNLDRTQITDAGLEHLRGLSSLEHLSLSGTAITGTGFRHLHSLRRLRILVADRTSVDDDALTQLDGLPDLIHLYLGATKLTDVGLKHLGRFEQLELVDVHGSQVTEQGIQALQAALPRLRIIAHE